jgi:hypothetical protein
MKKITLVLFASFITLSLSAQTSSGNMMIGGNLSFSSRGLESNSDYQDSEINFSPSFGYFVSDNFAVGASLSLGSGTEDDGDTKTVRSSFGFGPFARYYKFTSNENFAFFGQAQFLYSSGRVDDTPGGETRSQAITFSIAPGFSYFFTEHWALDLSITGLVIQSYDPNKDTPDNKSATIQFGLSSFSPNLGFRYHFGN